jgi:hypothetical protein
MMAVVQHSDIRLRSALGGCTARRLLTAWEESPLRSKKIMSGR